MNTNKNTFILFGRTNPYQAQRNGTFNGRTLIVQGAFYGTQEEASAKMLGFLEAENDNYHFDEAGNVVIAIGYDESTDTEKTELVGEVGTMSYEDDGYSWWYANVNELDEQEATIAMNSSRVSDGEKAEICVRFPFLQPKASAGE